MLLADYLTSNDELMWKWAKQLGVDYAVIRLPEDGRFELANPEHWKAYYDRFLAAGLTPVVVEPLPNSIYDEIKCGTSRADEAMETAKAIVRNMGKLHIDTLCMNFMAHIGWYRTASDHVERGGALSTAFDMKDFAPADDFEISEAQLWKNLESFFREIVPVAEANGVKLALHPDDPPVPQLGGVHRILISKQAIDRAIHLVESDCLGVTLCQGCYSAMGENVYEVIEHFGRQGKIFYVHFRDVRGNREHFCETFHDNGQTDMARTVHLYNELGFDGAVRVDHVPTMAGESTDIPGYANLGRLYAIGYLKGLIEADQMSGGNTK